MGLLALSRDETQPKSILLFNSFWEASTEKYRSFRKLLFETQEGVVEALTPSNFHTG